MACRTQSRESGRDVARIGGFVEVADMATGAIGWDPGELASNVALVARHAHMGPRQGELRRGIVIELRTRPRRRRMAQPTVSREVGCAVIGIGSVVEVIEMATDAIRRYSGKLPAHMALRAGNSDVCAGQRELCQIVVELRALPVGRCVTAIALRCEVEAPVIGIGRLRIVGEVATRAIRRSARETPVDMAGRAVDADVRTRQPKLRCVVIEGRTLPVRGSVTPAAVAREPCGHVIGLGRRRKGLCMTPIAFRGSALKAIADMTSGTRELGVHAR